MKREEFLLGVCIYIILTIPTFAGPAIKEINEHLLNVSFYPKVKSFFKTEVWEHETKLNQRVISDHQKS